MSHLDCEDGGSTHGIAEKQDERNLRLPTSPGVRTIWTVLRKRKKPPRPFNLSQCILGHLFIKLCVFEFSSVHKEAVFRRGNDFVAEPPHNQ